MISVVNTSTAPADASVSFRIVDGPCGEGNLIELSGTGIRTDVRVPAGDGVTVSLPAVEVPALGRAMIELEATRPSCPPSGADPRSITFQVFTLTAGS